MKDIFEKIDIDLDQIEIPKEILLQWENLLDLLLEFTASQDALINNYQAPYLKVDKADYREINYFSEGDKFKLKGLYCEDVVSQKSSIKVKNAEKNPKWQDSIYIENGLIAYLGYPILWPNGEVYGTICIHDDKERNFGDKAERVMELVRNIIENNLEVIYQNQINYNLRNYYSQLYNLLPVGVTIEDEKGNIIWVNDRISEISGFKKEELIGNNIFDTLILEENKEIAKENIKKILSGKTLIHDTTASNAQGEKLHLKLREKKIKLPNGKTGIVSIQSDISDTVEVQRKIKYASLHDSLTSLYNRSYLENKIQALNTSRRLPIAVIMVDVNGLKLVNDTYGHNNGDFLLKKVANILKKSCRQEDIVARWGGDEFVIILPKTNENEAVKIVDRIDSKIKKASLSLEDGHKLPISAAIGYQVNDNYYQDLTDSLNQAEEMMYKNKLIASSDFKKEIINTMFENLNEKSKESKTHSQRMAELTEDLAKEIELPEEEVKKAVLAAKLHDLGKIVISENILNKKGKLTEDEWREIKEHPAVGHRILNATDEFSHISEAVLSHHERWDGKGYPRSLKGEEIPLIARIISIVDAYEVMTSDQPYKDAISKEEALKEIKNNVGSQFDPELSAVFIKLMENKDYHKSKNLY